MNKLLIVLLAVCLVSVHAFVKRDVSDDTLAKIQKDLAGMGEQAKTGFDSETINNLIDNFSKAVELLHEKQEEAKQ